MHVLGLVWASSVLVVTSGARDMLKNGPLQIPLVESRLCVMSLKSDRNVQLEFVEVQEPKRSFIISLAMAKYDNESQIETPKLGDGTAIVSRDTIDLQLATEQYISIFRKNNVVAVYRAGLTKPFLVYEYKGAENIDFGDFNVWYHTGPRDRSFLGIPSVSGSGKRIKAFAEPHGKVIKKELHEIRREMYRRLRILGTYLQKIDIQNVPKDTLLTLKSILDDNLSCQLALLDYYGVKMKGKYEAQRETLFKQTRPEINARISKI